jgi:hypothetical protein
MRHRVSFIYSSRTFSGNLGGPNPDSLIAAAPFSDQVAASGMKKCSIPEHGTNWDNRSRKPVEEAY